MSSEEILSDSSCEMCITPTIMSYGIISDDETESERENSDVSYEDNIYSNQEWLYPTGNQPNVKLFMGTSGVNLSSSKVLECNEPIEFYTLFLNEEVIKVVVHQTNLYANQIIKRNQSERLNDWIPTNACEIKKFFGLIMWMGLVKLPTIELYWSKNVLYNQSFPRTVMSRNRFEILLRMLHFVDNEQVTTSNSHLSKLQTLTDMLNKNFKEYYNPTESVCIHESVIPFGDRVTFRQYLKPKRRKYGIKLFKLCSTSGYTNSFYIYAGNIDEQITPTNVVMSLCQNIINQGHTLYTDNSYTSIELAEKLLSVNTHLIGTLQSNCHDIPKEILSKKLQRGEIIAREHKNGTTILKWKDKRDVIVLSTRHSTEMVAVTNKKNISVKPKIIVDYNASKSYMNISNQMTPHLSPLRKCLKWYKRLAFELLFHTSVLNSWIMYNSVKDTRMPILEFRQRLITDLTTQLGDSNNAPLPGIRLRIRHEISSADGNARQTRRQCKKCYEENVKKFGREFARNRTKKVRTFCQGCNGNPYYCLPCFNKIHRNIPM